MHPVTLPHHDTDPATEVGRHIPALDGIRALAILLVIPHNVDLLGTPVPVLAYPVALLMHAGWIGVQLFFVLSGFLISGNLLDARGSANYFRAFFGRRALRILPLYLAVLTCAFVIAPALFTLPPGLRATQAHQVWLWTFLANWTQPFDGGVYGFTHFWSLAVEEQFYLLWPLLAFLCGPVTLAWVCGAAAALALALRCALVVAQFPHDALYMFTPCRMDALALGALVAALIRIPSARARLLRATPAVGWSTVVVLITVAAGTRGFALYDVSTQTIGYTLLSLAFALLVLLATLPVTGIWHWVMRALSGATLGRVGRYSYGMYVFHLPLHVFFGIRLLHYLNPHPGAALAILYAVSMVAASFLVAAASYELFESRFLRMKRRFVPAMSALSP